MTQREATQAVLDNFNFLRVYQATLAYDLNGTRNMDINDLRAFASCILNSAYERGGVIDALGFRASYIDGVLRLTFALEDVMLIGDEVD
jgi:hypothetical protein